MQGQLVRYDGGHKRYPFYPILEANCLLIPFCPEAAAGLGVPRPPMDLRVQKNGAILAVSQADDSHPVDRLVREASQTFAANHTDLVAYIHMNRSPSCARGDAKVYEDHQQLPGRYDGLFTQELDQHLSQPLLSSDFETLLSPSRLLVFLAKVLRKHFTDSPLPPGTELIGRLQKISDGVGPSPKASRITSELSALGLQIPTECKTAFLRDLQQEWENGERWTY